MLLLTCCYQLIINQCFSFTSPEPLRRSSPLAKGEKFFFEGCLPRKDFGEFRFPFARHPSAFRSRGIAYRASDLSIIPSAHVCLSHPTSRSHAPSTGFHRHASMSGFSLQYALGVLLLSRPRITGLFIRFFAPLLISPTVIIHCRHLVYFLENRKPREDFRRASIAKQPYAFRHTTKTDCWLY